MEAHGAGVVMFGRKNLVQICLFVYLLFLVTHRDGYNVLFNCKF